MGNLKYCGIDIGSTTVKFVLMDKNSNILFHKYKRHYSDIRNTVVDILSECKVIFKDSPICFSVTGSGGISISKELNLQYIQEVIACSLAISKRIPETEVAIELGGEDAKILYFGNSIDLKMNGICAGGTGAFIDQMATLLKTDARGLNLLAKNSSTIHPIAARCGVFAKTDIQALINEGATRENIAASIFQSVVNQILGGLSCGKPIKGKVAFLGGPLSFLSELRNRFIKSLDLSLENVIIPSASELFVAIGAAVSSVGLSPVSLDLILKNISKIQNNKDDPKVYLAPLFKDQNEYDKFILRHNEHRTPRVNLKDYSGNCFLGIDAGSTTTKAILIDSNNNILYSIYKVNEGTPLEITVNILKKVYDSIKDGTKIVHSAIIGYGENLLKKALGFDIGEVETIAHYKAAKYFLPDVEFILDIGGQDMKCIKIKNGHIQNIIINEACSSGCGSFLQTFSNSLNIDLEEFVEKSLFAKSPIDLGTRCTVFMNSKVKQAQKDGATIGDISAGLSYSVIKNALNKVIRLRNSDEIGERVIVQGGTFYNNAVLRCFELISGKDVIRPDISGLMGAFGAAILAKEQYKDGCPSTLISKNELSNFSYSTENTRCSRCNNRCLLTIMNLHGKNKLIFGNKCERGESINKESNEVPNLYEYKLKRLFSYIPLSNDEGIRGIIGIPRVLNMYENYPFWYTFFTYLKFRVELSPDSSKEIYELGIETIPSDTVCYPVKLAHGHIISLVRKGIKTIFYPCVPYEVKEFDEASNNYNCSMVACYPEVIKNNIDLMNQEGVLYLNPFLSFTNIKKLIENLYNTLNRFGVSQKEVSNAVESAFLESSRFKAEIRQEGERVLDYLRITGKSGIVLSGRPYHLDPEIHQGIPSLIKSLGSAVLTEDSVSHLAKVDRPTLFIDQWMYHSRLYAAASFVRDMKDLDLIQLTSFGCGLDAITSEQAKEILTSKNKIYTIIKIDEIKNLGAIKIRIRSLKAVINDKNRNEDILEDPKKPRKIIRFTKEMKKSHTILIPEMAPIHFRLLASVLKNSNYNVELLQNTDREVLDEGLKYVNNDLCLPAIIIVGQILTALKSKKYDLHNTSIMFYQSGGGCRFTNYTGTVRKALFDAGYDEVPVFPISFSGLEKNPGFKITIKLVIRCIMAFLYGDLLMRLSLAVRPYEKIKGSTNELLDKWIKKCCNDLESKESFRYFKLNIKQIILDFEALEYIKIKKPVVGVTGEIYLKYNTAANNRIIEFLENEGVEVVVPEFIYFFLYCAYSSIQDFKQLRGAKKDLILGNTIIKVIEYFMKPIMLELNRSSRFRNIHKISDLAGYISDILSTCNSYGEGWCLTAEVVEFLEEGINNIICMQPFSCMPNHITGRGMFNKIKEKYPNVNITAIDYDPGASEVNQLNRLKLFLSVTFNNFNSNKESESGKIYIN